MNRLSPTACALFIALCGGCATAPAPRPFPASTGDRFTGNGISYGPHRDGQQPGGAGPTEAQLREDLALLLPRWSLWRIYSVDATAEAVLRLLDG